MISFPGTSRLGMRLNAIWWLRLHTSSYQCYCGRRIRVSAGQVFFEPLVLFIIFLCQLADVIQCLSTHYGSCILSYVWFHIFWWPAHPALLLWLDSSQYMVSILQIPPVTSRSGLQPSNFSNNNNNKYYTKYHDKALQVASARFARLSYCGRGLARARRITAKRTPQCTKEKVKIKTTYFCPRGWPSFVSAPAAPHATPALAEASEASGCYL